MATDYSTELTNTCMLVSDSNETGKQLDSKQLEYGTLVELAQDNLFKKQLDMSKYLTKNQFDAYCNMLEEQYGYLEQMKNALDISGIKPKFRVVDGQVILMEAGSIPEGESPEQHVRDKWDITSEYQLLPIPNCMLRGMLDVKEDGDQKQVSRLIPEKPDNEKVRLNNENMPPHMHHSSVTTGGNFSTLYGKESSSACFTPGNVVYDMFYNDSMDIGLSKNELDGTVDKFSVDAQGKNDTDDDANPQMYHDNMPRYHAFYGFVVRNVTR